MNRDVQHKLVEFGGAAVYRITVQGKLPPSWTARLSGMRLLESGEHDASSQQSVLEGLLRDQSDLSSVLNSLYSLHLPILRVEQIQDMEK